ncbi:MAG: S9 family peptidase [Bacteroidota bacterium]
MRTFVLIFFLVYTSSLVAFSQSKETTRRFEEILSLRSAFNPQISPDGSMIAYQVRSTDWKENRYDEEVWLYKEGYKPFQLTYTEKGSSTQPQWSHDSQWIAFLADRDGDNQVYMIRAAGGEAQQVTSVEGGIQQFSWSPTDLQIAFTKADKNKEEEKARKDRFGEFAVEDEEYDQYHLWTLEVQPDRWPRPEEMPCTNDSTDNEDCIQSPKPKQLTKGDDFSVSSFAWSPDGQQIAFQQQKTSQLLSFFSANIAVIDVQDPQIRTLVDTPGYDGNPVWSPDGQWIAYQSSDGDTVSNFYKNGKILKISADGSSQPQPIATDIDEEVFNLHWNPNGMYALARQRTNQYVYEINPESGKSKAILKNPDNVYALSFSQNGENLALQGRSATQLTEIYTTTTRQWEPVAVSNMTQQIQDMRVGSSEVIQWNSRDGVAIEGVLHKPADYDPSKQYPLMVVIHGGPTGIDTPTPVLGYVYPVNQWLEKGALVLRPNYRGSAGYGEDFRSLNVRNLGVGDTWDVMSGVDYLAEQNLIDTTRMGVMGWSQGGYISAFLATNTNRFKAISVGAGISDWTTYYVSTDIHPFTRQYLQATPWDDPEVYAKTSPMTNIRQASTPTLIQHGENDQRVPISNAYKLYQGLRDVQVDTKLIVYKDFGHGISKPRERLAAVWHNWQWFNKYLWNEPNEDIVEATVEKPEKNMNKPDQ